jgi:hypothetical protein
MFVNLPTVATALEKFSTTSFVKNYANATGFGVVGSKLYVHDGSSVKLIHDAFPTTAVNVGTLATVTGLTVVEKGFAGILHQSTFTLASMPLTLADATVGAGVKLYDFPTGVVVVSAAIGKVAETTTSVLASTLNTGVTYNWGVGTTTQANGTLATTEQDIIPTTNGTASATINVAGANSTGIRIVAPAVFNGNSSAKSLYFNVGVAGATDIDGDATTTWSGTIVVTWHFGGTL